MQGESCEWSIITHAPYRLFPLCKHRAQHKFYIFVRVTKELLAREQVAMAVGARFILARPLQCLGNIRQAHKVSIQPFLVWLTLRQSCLDLIVTQ